MMKPSCRPSCRLFSSVMASPAPPSLASPFPPTPISWDMPTPVCSTPPVKPAYCLSPSPARSPSLSEDVVDALAAGKTSIEEVELDQASTCSTAGITVQPSRAPSCASSRPEVDVPHCRYEKRCEARMEDALQTEPPSPFARKEPALNVAKELQKFFDKVPNQPSSSNGEDEELEMFRIAKEHGFDMRSAVGGRWQRAKNDDETIKNAYVALKAMGRPAQEKFRKEWAAQEFEKVQRKNEHCQSWKIVRSDDGEYVTFEKLIMKFGRHDSAVAIDAAMKYAAKCKLMSGNWIDYDVMAELCLYLHFTRKFRSVFSSSWSAYTSFTGHKDDAEVVKIALEQQGGKDVAHKTLALEDDASNVAPVDPPVEDVAKNAIAKTRANKKGKAAAKAAGAGKGGKKGQSPKKTEDPEMKASLQTAIAIKKDRAGALQDAAELRSTICSDPLWEWARDDKQQIRLNKAVEELEA